MTNNLAKKLNSFIFFIMGLIAFSGISSVIIFNVFRLPFYVIELLLMPFIIYFLKDIIIVLRRINANDIKWLAFWCSVFCISIFFAFKNGGHFTSTITMYRSIIYIILILFISRNIRNDISRNIYILSFGAIIGEFINIRMISDEPIMAVNLIALALVVIIPTIKKRIILSAFSFILAMLVSILSGFRINIVVTVISLFLSALWIFVKDYKKYLSDRKFYFAFLGLILMTVVTVINFEPMIKFIADIFNMDRYAYFRILYRMQAFLSLDFQISQDTTRLLNFQRIFTWFYDKIPITGLLGKDRNYLGYYIDIPIYFLYDLIGSIGAWLLFLYVFFRGLKNVLLTLQNRTANVWDNTCSLMFAIYIILFLLNGRFLYITYESILTGIIFANWFTKKEKE